MIIIVEGIDRVGKSILCKKLSKKMNIPIFKYDSKIIKVNERTNDYETDKTLLTLEFCKMATQFIIFDRLYFSDFVYGVLQRNYGTHHAKQNFKIIEESLEEKLDDVILILVEPTDIKKSSEEHGSDLSKHKKIFDELFTRSKIKNKWKCTYNTIDEAIMFINTVINKRMLGE